MRADFPELGRLRTIRPRSAAPVPALEARDPFSLLGEEMFRRVIPLRLIRLRSAPADSAVPLDFRMREESARERIEELRTPEKDLSTVRILDRFKAWAATWVRTRSRFTAGRTSGCREDSEILLTRDIRLLSNATRDICLDCS